MIPSIELSVVPIPSLLLLIILTLYRLTPLLSLLPILTPSLQKLANIIPHPRRARNLPREFFNLPPRPGSPSHDESQLDRSVRGRLGVRGGLMLLLLVEAVLSLACGWAALTSSSSGIEGWNYGLVATSLILLPTTIAWLAVFTISSTPALFSRNTQHRHAPSLSLFSKVRSAILRGGGITHSTLFPRILPLSMVTSALCIVPASALSSSGVGRYLTLAHLSLAVGVIIASAGTGTWRMYTKPREGRIRLRGESRMSLYEKEGMREFSYSPDAESVRFSADRPHDEIMERIREGSSWVSSPSRPPTSVSSFAYTPTNGNTTSTTADSYKTPKSKPSHSSFAASASFNIDNSQHGPATSTIGLGSTPTLVMPRSNSGELSGSAAEVVMNDQSWLSEPTNTPSSISSWSFPPSPEPAITRARSPSPSTLPLSPSEEGRSPNLPRPGDTRMLPSSFAKGSDTTTFSSTPGSAVRSRSQLPDGSFIADYSPDPFHPLPRGFESLTSFPSSPSQLESRTSLATRAAALRSGSTLACVPVEKVNERGSSTWTLQSYHSPSHDQQVPSSSSGDAYKTPDQRTSRARKALSTDRRAPPPPPMPTDMPLPPTLTVARSSTLFDLHGQKDSMELLMGMDGPEKDWVEVEREEDALEDWGRGGKGVGVAAVVATMACFAFALPLLLLGPTSIAITLYLVSLLLPSPFLLLISYLLRYRPIVAGSTARSKKSSTKTTSTAYRSLALLSESQLSLPLSISPKLTPPAPKRGSTLDLVSSPTLAKKLGPKPSLTTFTASGSRFTSTVNLVTHNVTKNERRHTVYGGLSFKDIQAEEAMCKTLARQSGDVWIESGHAIEGGGLISRATEMLKPVPAMRVLDERPRPRHTRDASTMRTFRGGIVSVLAKRASRMFDTESNSQAQELDDMSRFEDALDADVTASPARSGIAISIIAPSPDKRYSRARTQSLSSNGDGEPSWQSESAQITMAKRGRMSNGPMFIFNSGRTSEEDAAVQGTDSQGYELDWLTAGVLPGLVPGIKIGKDVRVEPVPSTLPEGGPGTPKARSRPLPGVPAVAQRSISEENAGDSSYATMPSFHAPSYKDQSTPHHSKHSHSRSYSSSVDFSKSPEYYTAESATSMSRELRQRNFAALGLGRSDTLESRRTIQHKPSFGLPRLAQEEDDFEGDLRKSFDELRRPHSSFMGAEVDEAYDQGDGVDLPPIPTSLTHRASLSRVSERTEEPTLSLSDAAESDTSNILSDSALEDMHLALALGTSPVASRSRSKLSDRSGDVSLAASTSTNEDAVEEMEWMMAMDTPTRAEFVISPPPSEYGGQSGRTSRASERSISTISTSASGYTTTTTSAADESSASVPPVPSVPDAYRRSHPLSAAVYSHPHPPPMQSAAFAKPAMPAHLPNGMINEPHYPVQSLLPKKSTETLHSVDSSSFSTSASTPAAKPGYKAIEARPSKNELRVSKLLEERNEQPRAPPRSQSANGYRKDESIITKRGLRPLTLVDDSQSNRMSLVVDRAKGGKRFSILQGDDEGLGLPAEATRANKGSTDEKRVNGTKGSKGDKENAKKGSKASTSSAVRGANAARGLRA